MQLYRKHKKGLCQFRNSPNPYPTSYRGILDDNDYGRKFYESCIYSDRNKFVLSNMEGINEIPIRKQGFKIIERIIMDKKSAQQLSVTKLERARTSFRNFVIKHLSILRSFEKLMPLVRNDGLFSLLFLAKKSSKTCYLIVLMSLTFNCSNPHEAVTDHSLWQFQAQREEIAPTHWVEENVLFEGKPTLALSGEGKNYVNGSWAYTYDIVPNKYYEFITYFKPGNVSQLDRTVLAQIIWQSSDGKRIDFIEFPARVARKAKGDWYTIRQTYQVPEGAVKAKVDLIYRWDADGSVFFGGTSLKETSEIVGRTVRLAAIHHRPQNTSSSQENLEQFKEYIEMAGNQKADIVCLPEGITVVSTRKTYVEVSEPIPGPTTKFLGKLAKKHNMYIIAGIYEREGSVVYNTSVLVGRDGELQGTYRKASLPREEIDGGITPGDEFPVFDTDFGRIGMMICWDLQFPEAARMLTLQGAEVIFMPIWGGDLILAKARAIENQIYLVSSTYDMKTGVFDKSGELIVEGTEEKPVAIVEVDLNQRKLWPWLGEYKNRIQRELPSSEAINY